MKATPIKIHTLGDLTRPIIAMAQDVERAEAELTAQDDGYRRRNYVRALFAMIEGSVYLLKQTALSAALRSRTPLTAAEYSLMSEEAFDLDATGKPRSQPKFLRVAENLRFTVACINRIFGCEVSVKADGRAWSDFKTAISVRNRIVHPKSLVDFDISVAEMRSCRQVGDGWFFELVVSLANEILRKITPGGPKRGVH